ncbi:MFS family permease [Actinoplanes octamycinicus]|uniref:MFS family permease n=1 Tax=Actinoplanes octamycinicus TaxID=135948 RepID=A0A7W7H3V5_9ACTN|nr:MFS transporter [Actinoplanes octamycinicus]MBB4743515.1 MFS family permease [Actinoplanes octamycinicus]GIE62499.1 MFS transporter [Actinoplanes octamycinicus]
MVLLLACVCQFMVILDAAIVNVALPSIQHDLGFTATGLAWVVNGYSLTFAGFMLLGGRAADLFGHRRMLVAGLGVFTAASLAAGLATSAGLLVAGRAAQGVGAAMLAPATLAVLNTHFVTPATRTRAFAAWSAAGGVGGMAGALAGGALTTLLSWRWVFLINVPIGAVLIAAALLALPARRVRERPSLDLLGALTGTAGLAMLIYGVMHGAGLPMLAGAALLGLFLLVEARFAARPMVPLGLFRIRGVAVGNVMLLLFGGIAVAMWYFTSLLLQNELGFTALRAGLGQTPAAVTFVLVARWAGALPPRIAVPAGCGCLVAGFGWLAAADGGYLTAVLGPTLIVAAGIALTFPAMMAAATSGVPEGDAGTAGGLATTSNQVGSAVALAVMATAATYDHVFTLAALIGLAIAVTGLLLPRSAHTPAMTSGTAR